MITKLKIENFRGFAEFEVKGIKPVNLIVGRNNGGKTSLLEAIHVGGSRGDYTAIQGISTRRGELLSLQTGPNGLQTAVDISCFYHNYEVAECSSFVIEGDGNLGKTQVHVREIAPDELRQGTADLAEFPATFVLEGYFNGDHVGDTIVNGGSVLRHGAARISGFPFVSADSLQTAQLRTMWDRVLARGDEKLVYKALRIIQPDVDDVQFLSNPWMHNSASTAGIVVRLKGNQFRVPLGSFGDGMRRLLSLAVLLASVETNQCVLIDEIDTGLHHSVLTSMWELIIQTAVERQVQIFATTHSLDCLRGLAAYCAKSKEHVKEVAVHKIDCNISKNVLVEGDLIQDFLGTFDPR